MNSEKKSPIYTLLFALSIALACGALVSFVSVSLEPTQEKNREQEQQRLLQDLLLKQPEFESLVDQNIAYELEHHLLDLDTGCFVDESATEDFIAKPQPDNSFMVKELDPSQDSAGIGNRPKYILVHLVLESDRLVAVTLPVRGLGYASQLHGYLTIGADTTTVRSLIFYKHNETPGMGGRISEKSWQAKWPGKQLSDLKGNIRIGVAVTRPTPVDDLPFQIDAMTGATKTGKGVTNILQFWAGPLGYAPFLANLRSQDQCVH